MMHFLSKTSGVLHIEETESYQIFYRRSPSRVVHLSPCAEVNHDIPVLSQQVKSSGSKVGDPGKRVTSAKAQPAAVPLSSGA